MRYSNSPLAARHLFLLSVIVAATGLLAGCTPKVVRDMPPGDVQLTQVRHDMDGHVGAVVRWGGSIISVENLEGMTRVEVLEVSQPSQERQNRMIEGDAAQQAAELIRILHEEDKLI